MSARPGAALRAAAALLGLDVVIPLVGYSVAAAWMWPTVWLSRATSSPLGLYAGSIDHQGTLWFYWWLRKWWSDGESLLLCRYACAPDAQFLRTNFPNRIDAWLAQPFLGAFPAPEALSLFVLALPVLGGFAAFALARQFTTDRVAAWLGGLPFAFQLYVSSEVAAGRPVTALLAPGVLFLAAFAWALHAPGRVLPVVATLVAGVLAGIAAEAYLPHAPYLGVMAAALALARVAWPEAGAARWRPFLVGPVALVVAVWVAGPYLYEVTVQRRLAPRDVHAADVASFANPVGDQRFWPALRDRMTEDLSGGQTLQGGPVMSSMGFDAWFEAGPWYRSVQAESLGWDWPWESSLGRGQRLVALGSVWLAAGVALGLLGRARGVAFLGLALGCYLLSLGPALMTGVEPRLIHYVGGGDPIGLPTRWLLDAVPTARMFLRPYRLAPYVHLFLGVGLALGLARLGGSTPVWEGESGARRLHRWALGRRLAVAVGGAALAVVALGQVREHPAFAIPVFEWNPSPFLVQMGQEDEDYAIAEIPVGIGQHRAGAATVHGKRRAEPLQDIQPGDRGGRRPPDCYDLPFLDGLWYLGLPDATAQAAVEAHLTPEARVEAREAGFRYVVVWTDVLRDDIRRGDPRKANVIVSELDARLGPRHYEDDQVIVYAL